jgi:FkbM family methyltransferase
MTLETIRVTRDGHRVPILVRAAGTTEGITDRDAIREIWDEDVYQIDGFEMTNSWAVDVGSHIGAFSIRTGLAGANVLAIEPDPVNVEILTANLYNNLSPSETNQIVIVEAAADSAPGKISIDTDGTGMGHSGRGNLEVDAVRVSDLFEEHDIAACAVLKVDIEGWEYQIVDDLALVFPRCDRIVFETHEIEDSKPLGKLLAALLETHNIRAFGKPSDGGQIYARRY